MAITYVLVVFNSQHTQYGFILTLVRHVEVYLAVPDEILLQIPLSQLVTYTRSHGPAGTVDSAVKNGKELFNYLARDLFILRRYVVEFSVRLCPNLTKHLPLHSEAKCTDM